MYSVTHGPLTDAPRSAAVDRGIVCDPPDARTWMTAQILCCTGLLLAEGEGLWVDTFDPSPHALWMTTGTSGAQRRVSVMLPMAERLTKVTQIRRRFC